mmetsp:Transcript_9684/g.30135  ORF Transcript_9684/g.30135 Transcript_9684/m.30135 type:complete len:201 (-) Transcript_9684:518-1120(-)
MLWRGIHSLCTASPRISASGTALSTAFARTMTSCSASRSSSRASAMATWPPRRGTWPETSSGSWPAGLTARWTSGKRWHCSWGESGRLWSCCSMTSPTGPRGSSALCSWAATSRPSTTAASWLLAQSIGTAVTSSRASLPWTPVSSDRRLPAPWNSCCLRSTRQSCRPCTWAARSRRYASCAPSFTGRCGPGTNPMTTTS